MSTTASATKEYNVKVIMSIGEKLYLNEETADFHFVFKLDDDRYERIPAHKLLLAAASDVFGAMLNGTWIEKDEAKIVDASASAFKEFLQFIYLTQAKVTTENVYQVMNLANMYDITECLNACQDFLINTLTIETMCLGYAHAILLENQELMTFCEQNIKENAKKIFSSKSFLDCNQNVLRHILQLDCLTCTDLDVIEACMSWLKSYSQQEHLTREIVQEHLGDLFYDIPFDSMSFNEFAAFDRLYEGLLTYAEHREIIQMIASEDFQPKLFHRNRATKFENPKWNENTAIPCNRGLNPIQTKYFIKNIQTTTFSTNKAILLGALIFPNLWTYHAGVYHPVEFSSKITITETNESKTSDDGVIVYNGKAKLGRYTRMLLSHTILIKPGFEYVIRTEQNPPFNCLSSFSLKSEVEIQPGTIIKFHRSNERADQVMGSIIWGLEFNHI